MSGIPPLACVWSGDAFEPIGSRAKAEADKYYVVGQRYAISVHEDRSGASHRHYFSCVREVWKNLSDTDTDRFPTETHLRRFALIKTGFCNSQQFVAGSNAEAIRLAAFMAPIDEYSLLEVKGRVVTRWTARSQNMRSMDKREFAQSKEKVLDFLAAMIGVKAAELERNAEQVAA